MTNAVITISADNMKMARLGFYWFALHQYRPLAGWLHSTPTLYHSALHCLYPIDGCSYLFTGRFLHQVPRGITEETRRARGIQKTHPDVSGIEGTMVRALWQTHKVRHT